MAIIYKHFLPEDIDKYFTSYWQTIDSLVPMWKQTPVILKASLENIIQQWTIVHIAVDEELDEIVWTASTLIEFKLHRWWCKAWHIEDVATREGRWGKWIWSELITQCLQSAKDAWCYKIILDCTEELSWYYARFGFEVKGVEMKKYL